MRWLSEACKYHGKMFPHRILEIEKLDSPLKVVVSFGCLIGERVVRGVSSVLVNFLEVRRVFVGAY